MKMYSQKNLNYGFIILCPDANIALLKSTVSSILIRHPGKQFLGVSAESILARDFKEMKNLCPLVKGGSTITSLINAGMAKTKAEWNFIFFAGVLIRRKIDERFSHFIENEKDILFPILDGKCNFVDATLNGLFINKNTWDAVGKMDDEGKLDFVKCLWAAKAIDSGVKFKAIAGAKIC